MASDPKEVNNFHTKSDVDSSPFAQHHTIGPGRNQAAAGDHLHIGFHPLRLGTHTKSSATGFTTNTGLYSVTIPADYVKAGGIYRAHCNFEASNGSAGATTVFNLKYGISAVTGGTMFRQCIITFATGGRRYTVDLMGEFVYGGSDGDSPLNVICMGEAPSAGTTTEQAGLSYGYLVVERVG